jgi:CheY-like chemotaxis protein
MQIEDWTVQPNGEKLVVLLAEDNESNINLYTAYLGSKGLDIRVTRNGREVVACARQSHPAIILMDIQMPEMDGLQAIRQIKSDPELSKLTIIAVTALTMSGDRARCLDAGADAYLSKPVSLGELWAIIKLYCEKESV